MASIPNISVAKPKSISPLSFFFPLLQNIYSIIPAKARTGVKEEGLRSFIKILSLSIPERLSTHAVTVVPTLAPIITFIDCFSVISPEFTKPTTITVTAEEL